MAHMFAKFLIDLGDDPRSLATFEQNPREAMARAGLSEAEQSIIASRDPLRISAAIQHELGGVVSQGELAAVWVVVLVSVAISGRPLETNLSRPTDLVARLRSLSTLPTR